MTQLYIFGKTWHNSIILAKIMTQLYIFGKTGHNSIILAKIMTQLYIFGKTGHNSIILAKLSITGPENLQILCTYRESQPETEKSNPPISSKW
jgi:hypothetical protein